MRQCFLGLRRFGDFQETLGIARNILSERLHTLVDADILERRPHKSDASVIEYRLTQKGLDLYPAIAALLEWGDRYMMDELGPPVLRIHKSCGHEAHAQLTCAHCGELITAHDIELKPGPSAYLGSPLDEALEQLARRKPTVSSTQQH